MSAKPSKPVTAGATPAHREEPLRAVIAGYPPAGRYSSSAGNTTGMLLPVSDKPRDKTEQRRVRVFRIAIPASRIEASKDFYEAVLGIGVDATVPTRLYFHCGDVILALIDWTVEGRDNLQPTPDNLYLATDELDDLYERAVAAGARIVSPIETRAWGERSFYCLDPDGNRLCFVDDSTLFLGRGADWS